MSLRRREVLQVLGAGASGLGSALLTKEVEAKSGELERDVCIVGGGAAGTYAAVRLRELGKSVVVVERTHRLGGHCETYLDPASGTPIDIGVVVFPDLPLVRSYFDRFQVPLATASFAGSASQYVDFRTGKSVAAYEPSGVEVGTALFTYLQILQTKFGFLEQNGFQLPSSGPLLEELLLPFGQWAQSYGLNALIPTFFLFEQGFGPLLGATTLYVLKNMNASVVGSVLQGSFLSAPSGAGALYDAASTELEADVLYDADITRVERDDRVRLEVSTPRGKRRVKARKLLVTAPPILSTFSGFDLDFREFTTFARFRPHHYWTAVVGVQNLPPGVSLVNAAAETPFNLAPLPGIYSVGPSGAPGAFNVKYGSDGYLPDVLVKLAIKRDIERVKTSSGARLKVTGFGTFKNHSPYSVVAAPEQIRSGFYRDLQALQGRNRTYYAGAAHQTHSSASIWAFLEELLPSLSA